MDKSALWWSFLAIILIDIHPRAAEGGPRGSGVTGRANSWWSTANSSEMAGPTCLQISGCVEEGAPQVWGEKILSLLGGKKNFLFRFMKFPITASRRSNVLSGPRGSWDFSQPSAWSIVILESSCQHKPVSKLWTIPYSNALSLLSCPFPFFLFFFHRQGRMCPISGFRP